MTAQKTVMFNLMLFYGCVLKNVLTVFHKASFPVSMEVLLQG
jgi:hypothetical protein